MKKKRKFSHYQITAHYANGGTHEVRGLAFKNMKAAWDQLQFDAGLKYMNLLIFLDKKNFVTLLSFPKNLKLSS